jgi:isoamyl acetate esterase
LRHSFSSLSKALEAPGTGKDILRSPVMPKRKAEEVDPGNDKATHASASCAGSGDEDNFRDHITRNAPSTHWTGLDDFDAEGNLVKRIRHVLEEADFDILSSIALEVRKRILQGEDDASVTLDLSCSIDTTKFACGATYLVVEIKFSDGVFWIARTKIPDEQRKGDRGSPRKEGRSAKGNQRRTRAENKKADLRKNAKPEQQNLDALMLSEIATMRIVRERTFIPVPQVFAFSATTQNPFGYRYMLMEAMPGHLFEDNMASSPKEHREKVASQFARIVYELSNVTFDRIGDLWCGTSGEDAPEIVPFETYDGSRHRGASMRKVGPFRTSLEYFYTRREGMNRCLKQLHPDDPEMDMACWVLKQALPFIIKEKMIEGPFVLRHRNLHYRNIMMDDDYNITGVMDWADAHVVPVELFAVIPDFQFADGPASDQNKKIRDFKHLFLRALKRIEDRYNELDLQRPAGFKKPPSQIDRTLRQKEIDRTLRQKETDQGKQDDESSEDALDSESVGEENNREDSGKTRRTRLSRLIASPRTALVRNCFDRNLGPSKYMARFVASTLYGGDEELVSGGIAWEQLERSFEATECK